MRRWLILLCLAGCTRYSQLRAVIQTHLGFAHFTWGVNTSTVAALRSHVTSADVPVLLRMLHDRHHVNRLAAAAVLAELDRNALIEVYQQLKAEPRSDEELFIDVAEELHLPLR